MPTNLLQLITRINRALARDGDAALQTLGLRYAQIPVVAYLLTRGSGTQKDLAEATAIEQPSMAQLLTRMDRDGIVTHGPHPTDARSRIITLVDSADPRFVTGDRMLTDLEHRALYGLDPAEVETLRRLLGRVQQNLENV